jgi:hypothetical protein
MAVKEIAVGQRFLALATDMKPINGVSAGAVLKETDTYKDFIFDGESWVPTGQKNILFSWLNETIAPQSFFARSIPCADFDVATAFIAASGSSQVSFRVTDPEGSDYAWDPLGTMNGASLRASAQAEVTGLPYVKLVVTNGGEQAITVNVFAYLGKRGF